MSKQQFFGRSTPHHLQISSKLALRLFSELKKSWKFRLNIFTTSKVKSIWSFTCFCQLSLFANWQFGWNFETNNWITWEPLNIFAEIFSVFLTCQYLYVLRVCFRPYHLDILSKTWAQKDEIFDIGENFYEYNFLMVTSSVLDML